MSQTETVILAGGCFWGMQDLIRKLSGVLSTRVGYSGDDVLNATYRKHGTHAEAIEVVFDPGKLTSRNLLEVFFQIHDPTTLNLNIPRSSLRGSPPLPEVLETTFCDTPQLAAGSFIRQGNDVGTSYRSGIYYTSEDQRRVAEHMIAEVNASGLWPDKVVTEIRPAGPFWLAEPEHQDYLERNPHGYSCHFPRPHWKVPSRAVS